MGNMAALALFVRRVHLFLRQNFSRMTAQTILIGRLDPRMRLMAFIAVEPRHRHLLRERRLSRPSMTAEAALPVGNKCLPFLWRKSMTPQAGNIFHAHAVNLPIFMTTQTGVPVRPECMHLPAVTVPARQF